MDENATLLLFKQMMTAVWSTLERSLKVNRLSAVFEFGHQDDKQRIRHQTNLNESNSRYDHDYGVYSDCLARNPKVKTLNDLCKSVTKRG